MKLNWVSRRLEHIERIAWVVGMIAITLKTVVAGTVIQRDIERRVMMKILILVLKSVPIGDRLRMYTRYLHTIHV